MFNRNQYEFSSKGSFTETFRFWKAYKRKNITDRQNLFFEKTQFNVSNHLIIYSIKQNILNNNTIGQPYLGTDAVDY